MLDVGKRLVRTKVSSLLPPSPRVPEFYLGTWAKGPGLERAGAPCGREPSTGSLDGPAGRAVPPQPGPLVGELAPNLGLEGGHLLLHVPLGLFLLLQLLLQGVLLVFHLLQLGAQAQLLPVLLLQELLHGDKRGAGPGGAASEPRSPTPPAGEQLVPLIRETLQGSQKDPEVCRGCTASSWERPSCGDRLPPSPVCPAAGTPGWRSPW